MSFIKVALLPGDGIGPEVVAQAVKVLNAIAARHKFVVQLEEALIGAVAIDKTGDPLPPQTIELCKNSDAVLLGAVGHPKYDNDPSAKVRPEQGLLGIRQALGLFSNIRPIATYPLLYKASPLRENLLRNVDFVIYRELTGGIYFGDKGRTNNGEEAYDHCVYSRQEIVRIARMAFEAARKRRKHLTLVDKANVLETSRLWRETVRNMAPNYPDVVVDYMFVDAASMKIIQNPSFFDVVLTENMFGDILTDEASVITGSIGMLPSASLGENKGLFEPIHGSWPEGAGKNIANPYGTILSVAMMMDYLGLTDAASDIRRSVSVALENKIVTGDIDQLHARSTEEIGDYIANIIGG